MSLSTHYTLSQLREVVKRELLDPTNRWWSVDELNSYINDWSQILQSQYEFTWGTATITLTDTTSEFSISTILPNAMRVDAVYYCPGGTATATGRLSPRSPADLDTLQRNWRSTVAVAGIDPIIVYQNNAQAIALWPPPHGTGTVYLEYPVITTMTAGTSTMQMPAWTRYSCISYCLYRSYARFGPNQDLRKAVRRRKQWEREYKWIRKVYDAYFPDKSEMLRPGRKWYGHVVRSKPFWPTYS